MVDRFEYSVEMTGERLSAAEAGVLRVVDGVFPAVVNRLEEQAARRRWIVAVGRVLCFVGLLLALVLAIVDCRKTFAVANAGAFAGLTAIFLAIDRIRIALTRSILRIARWTVRRGFTAARRISEIERRLLRAQVPVEKW